MRKRVIPPRSSINKAQDLFTDDQRLRLFLQNDKNIKKFNELVIRFIKTDPVFTRTSTDTKQGEINSYRNAARQKKVLVTKMNRLLHPLNLDEFLGDFKLLDYYQVLVHKERVEKQLSEQSSQKSNMNKNRRITDHSYPKTIMEAPNESKSFSEMGDFTKARFREETQPKKRSGRLRSGVKQLKRTKPNRSVEGSQQPQSRQYASQRMQGSQSISISQRDHSNGEIIPEPRNQVIGDDIDSDESDIEEIYDQEMYKGSSATRNSLYGYRESLNDSFRRNQMRVIYQQMDEKLDLAVIRKDHCSLRDTEIIEARVESCEIVMNVEILERLPLYGLEMIQAPATPSCFSLKVLGLNTKEIDSFLEELMRPGVKVCGMFPIDFDGSKLNPGDRITLYDPFIEDKQDDKNRMASALIHIRLFEKSGQK